MLITKKNFWNITENQVTPESFYKKRRFFLKQLGAAGLTSSFFPFSSLAQQLSFKKNKEYLINDPLRPLTSEKDATSYNNFYEFSLKKTDVKEKVKQWKLPEVWEITVKGLDGKVKIFDLESLIKKIGLEERIYRFRCVEAWSMVLPWLGFPLKRLIEEIEPSKKAKYIKFQSFYNVKQAPNFKKLSYYPWPYTEGLRMDEALNPLAFMATGLYGKTLPKQNGAPLRLVVPWKYGFKSIKSIVKIEFTNKKPLGLWEELAPKEYGFYANVNPTVHHPRWSQATEKVIDGSLGLLDFIFGRAKRIPTLMFNGYEKQVSYLYKGLDLRKHY